MIVKPVNLWIDEMLNHLNPVICESDRTISYAFKLPSEASIYLCLFAKVVDQIGKDTLETIERLKKEPSERAFIQTNPQLTIDRLEKEYASSKFKERIDDLMKKIFKPHLTAKRFATVFSNDVTPKDVASQMEEINIHLRNQLYPLVGLKPACDLTDSFKKTECASFGMDPKNCQSTPARLTCLQYVLYTAKDKQAAPLIFHSSDPKRLDEAMENVFETMESLNYRRLGDAPPIEGDLIVYS